MFPSASRTRSTSEPTPHDPNLGDIATRLLFENEQVKVWEIEFKDRPLHPG